MDSDLSLILGMIVATLSAPAILGCFMGGRIPRLPFAFFLLGCSLMTYAMASKPSGYKFQDIPPALSHVIEKYLG